MIKLKILLFVILAQLLVGPVLVSAADLGQNFKAVVVDVLDQRKVDDGNGQLIGQQNLKLLGLDGDWQGKEIIYEGIGDLVVLNSTEYKVGDKVLVNQTVDDNGEQKFYVVDYVRTGGLWWLFVAFLVAVVLVGRIRGARSVLALIISFLIIIKFFVPMVMAGHSPIIWGLVSVALILPAMIIITGGWNKKSIIAIISIFICLALTMLLSVIFTGLINISGTGNEEAMLLMGTSKQIIDFKGLFLVAILIGALGVLDDVVLAQIESVAQIKMANSELRFGEIFKMANEIGKSHLGAMINTLFLAYVGVSLPLLLLLSLKQPPFVSMFYAINSEIIAIEIVRALVGGMGLALAIPISTYLAVKFVNNKKLA